MTVLSLTTPHQVLDPTLLGQPVHLLPTFAAQLRDDLAQALRLPGNRRNWAPFHVDAAAFVRAGAAATGERWLSCAAAGGVLGFRLERSLLLAVLNHRYGQNTTIAAAAGQGHDEAAAAKAAAPRVTATEERLALALGQQLAAALASRIGQNLGSADAGAAVSAGPGRAPAQGSWLMEVSLTDAAGSAAGRFWFALDQPLMTAVLRGLLPARHSPAAPPSAGSLASRLQVSLSGRLMSREILLGSLFDLRVGDIIPVSLNRTDVLLDHSRLFTAAVTEHKGKLCLTAFEDAN